MEIANSKPIQIILYLGFDDESDEALQNAWNAVRELMDDGIYVELIPYNIWLTDPTGLELAELPKIIIDDELVSIGEALSSEEIKYHVKRKIMVKQYMAQKKNIEQSITA